MGPTIGLYYNGARCLAAWLGRWTSADPIGIGADGPGLYNYTRGSPVNYTDPSGTQQVPAPPGYSKDRDVAIEHAPNAQGEIVVESQHFVDVDKARANPVLNVAPASSGAVLDDPDYIEHLRGIGVIELGDAKAFGQGGWNDTGGWLTGSKFDIDPEHEGGAIMGGHFFQNLAAEGVGGLIVKGIGRGIGVVKGFRGVGGGAAAGVEDAIKFDKGFQAWSRGATVGDDVPHGLSFAEDVVAGGTRAADEAAAPLESVSLGPKIFSDAAEVSGAIAEDVVLRGDQLILENFTIQSIGGGRDLVGPLRKLIAFAQDSGAKTITFRGTFSNPDLAKRFGKQIGDEFSVSTPATREGILDAARKLQTQ